MKLIKPKFEIWKQGYDLASLYKQIEKCGRICYRSENKITEDSAKPFVDRMIKSGHGAVLEHGTVYLRIPNEKLIRNFLSNTPTLFEKPWCKIYPYTDSENYVYITTNYRHIVENKLEDLLKYLCEPTEFHEKRITVHFVCDRGILAEFTRHRTFSFSAESTRYCNYSKDKFGNEVAFIVPCWADSLALQEVKGTIINSDDFGNLIGEYYYHLSGKEAPYFKTWKITPERNFIVSLQVAEQLYLELLNQGWKPQEARAVLPNALKIELVMTGFVEDWINFFKLRTASNAHPQARELAIPLKEEFIKRGYINE